MKPVGLFTFGLILTVCALLFVGSTQTIYARDYEPSRRGHSIFATGAADGGRLIIKRSPVLGYNVPITVWIDGELAGAFVWGHTYDRYITPGRHLLVAEPNLLRGDWHGILDVRPGQTYTFIASITPKQLILELAPSSR
jgi:hypothetical protein